MVWISDILTAHWLHTEENLSFFSSAPSRPDSCSLHGIRHKPIHSAIFQPDIFCSNGLNLLYSLKNAALKINCLNQQLDFQQQKIISNIHMRFPLFPRFPLTCCVLYPVEGAVHKSLGECSRKKWTWGLRNLCGMLCNQITDAAVTCLVCSPAAEPSCSFCESGFG